MSVPQEGLRDALRQLGFDDVRFVRLERHEGGFLRDWIGKGRHADMDWMERSIEKRLDPSLVLPGAKSAILLGVNYWQPVSQEDANPVWARYAQYLDYHDTIKPALVRAGQLLQERYGLSGEQYRYYVDTGPVVERGWSARAGLGFVGKNGMLISRRYGNWLFLAAILVAHEFEEDPPIRQQAEIAVGALCGKCTRCSEACPTGAIVGAGVVDARLCISYQTIENRGIIPRELRTKIGAHVYGCDVCLEVCPWNRFAQESRAVLLDARPALAKLTLAELLAMTPESFAAVFKGTAIKRVKLAGLLRNACIVAGNTGDRMLVPALLRLARHELPMVRVHAVWAVFRLLGRSEATVQLSEARGSENDPAVLTEYDASSRKGE
jgi:epoxyqueuosine reductase